MLKNCLLYIPGFNTQSKANEKFLWGLIVLIEKINIK